MKRSSVFMGLATASAMGVGAVSAEGTVLYSQDFESVTSGYVTQLEGWTSSISNAGYIRSLSVAEWAGNHTYGVVLPVRQAMVTSPSVDTSAYEEVTVSVDIRPSVIGTTYGGAIFLYDADGGAITRLLLKSDIGRLQVWDGASTIDTALPWTLGTPAHVDFTIDNVQKTWTLSYDEGDEAVFYTGAWRAGAVGSTYSYTTFQSWDGTTIPTALAVDNFQVTAVPEPASLALLGLASLAALRRRS